MTEDEAHRPIAADWALSPLEFAAGMGAWEYDLDLGSMRLSAAAHAEPLDAWLARLHPDDRAAAHAAFEAAAQGAGPLRGEWRLGTAGAWQWMELRGQALPMDGLPEPRVLGVLLDIAQRKARETVALLALREVEHRAKNALATAQALVRLTRADDPRDFIRSVEQRLAALGRAHAQLSALPTGAGVLLGGVAEAELAPYGDRSAWRLAGPELVLAPMAVQPLCMALHELVTNAAKYGGLSRPGGLVALRWRMLGSGGVLLCWQERGGPALATPPERRGFGLAMLDGLVQGQLGGVLRFAWRSGGLRVRVWLPRGRIVAARR
jgi:two-component sensor histidine kinase